jgi:hypothetical protein
VGSGTTASTLAAIVDTPPFVVGALRLTVPALPPSAETIVKVNPSRICVSGELNTIDALLVLPEIAPLNVPVNVIEPAAGPVSVTVRVKVSATADGVAGSAVEVVVNVPKLMLFTGGTVADDIVDV